MENTIIPPQKPVLIDEPPTFEYVDPKKNRKRVIEICIAVIIISIPFIISLFKIDYTARRVYEVVNPAYIGTSPDYGTWGGIVSAAKKIIQPVIHLPEETNTATTIAPTATPTPSPLPQANQQQKEQHQQGSDSVSPLQNQNQIYSSPQTEEQVPNYPAASAEKEPTATPTNTPTPTPTVTPVPVDEQQNYSNSDQVDAYAAYTACFGKKKNTPCSYQSSYGDKINGKCLVSDGHLMCIH